MKLALEALEHGNKNAASDAVAAAQIANATAQIASYNVRINLPGIGDANFCDAAVSRMESAMGRIESLLAEADRIFGASEGV